MTGWYPHVHGHRTMHYMLHTDQGDSSILSELKNKDYYIWWGGKNDLIAGQEGYHNHCDIYFDDDWSIVYGALDFIKDYKKEKPF